jgi:hypothetical protein
MTIPYVTGTVSVTAGSAVVTGSGTAWATALVAGGLFGLDSNNGNPVPILSVDSNTQLTLAKPWRGTTAAGQGYWIVRDTAYLQQQTVNAQALSTYIQRLDNAALAALAGLTPAADKFAYFNGALTAVLADIRAKGRDLLASSDMATVLDKLGPVFGGIAPVPSAAEVGLNDGDFNTILFPGVYTIAGTWTNGYIGQAAAGYTGVLVVYARRFNNLFIQQYFQNELIWTRFSIDGVTWLDWTTYLKTTGGVINGTSISEVERLVTIRDNRVTAGDTMNAVFSVTRQNAWTPALIIGNDGNSRPILAGNNADLRIGKAVNEVFTEYLRVGTNGSVYFGVTAPIDPTVAGSEYGLEIVSPTGRMRRRVNGYNPFQQSRMTTAGALQEFFMDTASVGSITVTATATNYATSSDYRLKTNVSPLVEFSLTQEQFDLLDDTLLRVMCYRPVSYKWLNDPDSGLAHGFIAHELQDVAQHAVTGSKDGAIDIGTAVIPEIVVPERTIRGQAVTVIDPETGETREMREPDQIVPAEVIPERRIENITREEAPEGATWTKTGSRPDFQGVDPSKLVPDLVAALQSATVMILEQHKSIDALTARVAALEVANQPS